MGTFPMSEISRIADDCEHRYGEIAGASYRMRLDIARALADPAKHRKLLDDFEKTVAAWRQLSYDGVFWSKAREIGLALDAHGELQDAKSELDREEKILDSIAEEIEILKNGGGAVAERERLLGRRVIQQEVVEAAQSRLTSAEANPRARKYGELTDPLDPETWNQEDRNQLHASFGVRWREVQKWIEPPR